MIVAGIPAYNEEGTISRVIMQAQRHVDSVIVCDDGSTDATAEIAGKLGADVLVHERNRGYGVAIRSLFQRAKELDADVLVTLDGDGQHAARDIPSFVDPILKGEVDITIGTRFLGSEAAVPAYRQSGIKMITGVTGALSQQRLSDSQCGFRAYGRKALARLLPQEPGMGVSVEMLMMAKKRGLSIAEVPTKVTYNGLANDSSQHPVRHGASVLFSLLRVVVEDRPLLLLGMPGLTCLLTGTLFGVWLLQIYALERRIITNIALAAIVFVLLGIFTVFTAITLYAINRLSQKINHV